jgi:predicted DNA-binding protein YlxM (UPF0122 family)
LSITEIIEEWKGKPLREVILDLYIDQDLSMRGVAKELHLSLGQVHKLIKELGISKNKDIFD